MPDPAPAVSVLYFAALRDLAGRSEEQVSLARLAPEHASVSVSVAALLDELEQRHEALRGRLTAIRVAVNEEFVEAGTQLHSGDVVALIPPVSGG